MTRFNLLKIPLVGLLAAAILLLGLLPPVPAARAAGSINLPRTNVPQGAVVAISGNGFTANDTVVAYADATVQGHGQRIQTSTTADGNGAFSTHLNLPRFIDPGYYTLVVKDTHGVTATSHLTVLALVVLHAGTTASPVPVVDRHGFFVDALGFQKGEPVKITATFPTYAGNNIVEVRNASANGNGDVFNVGMNAPAGAKAGSAYINATGQSSNKQAQGHVNVVYRPYVFLNHRAITVGAAVEVMGRAFASNATVRVQITVQTGGGNSQTLTVNATTDNSGNFSKWVRIPNYASPGTYTVTVTGLDTGIKRYAKLTVNARPSPKATATPTPKPTPKPTAKPTATLVPTYHASIQVLPATTLPNQDVSTSGQGFPKNAQITVSVTVDMRGGGNRYISKTVYADNTGSFSTAFRVPYKAAPGTYTVTASTSNVQASNKLQVLPLSRHPKNLRFQWISLWYHTVRQGTWDYIVIQASLHTQLGIWVHVIFPNGYHADFYRNTDGSGRWAVKFTIPRHGRSKHSNQAYIAFQLWHGKSTTQSFVDFTLV